MRCRRLVLILLLLSLAGWLWLRSHTESADRARRRHPTHAMVLLHFVELLLPPAAVIPSNALDRVHVQSERRALLMLTADKLRTAADGAVFAMYDRDDVEPPFTRRVLVERCTSHFVLLDR